MVPRRIALVTGSRADFGHLVGLAKGIAADPDLELQLIVTGAHLSAAHGMTVKEIEAEGLSIAARAPIPLAQDNNAVVAHATGEAVSGIADAYEKLAPDLAVVLGDRFEILAAAVAALVMRVPLVHIHGGEVTTGAFDDSIRHAISKMASLHLVAAEPYRRRLIQMGEASDRVHNVGAPALEMIRNETRLSREALERELDVTFGRPLVLMTFHPATHAAQGAERELESLLQALDGFPDITLVITGVNVDPGSDALRKRITRWGSARKGPTHLFESLGRRRYVSLVALADAMIGNSSSGYIEGPAFGVPVIDVGDRQTGRLAAACIERVAADADRIAAALKRAFDPEYKERIKGCRHPYDAGSFVQRSLGLLKSVPLGPELLRKPFYDLPDIAAAS